MEHWYVGQPVITLENGVSWKKNDEKVIHGVKLSPCKCKHVSINVGTNSRATHHNMECRTCGHEWPNEDYFHERAFAALDTDISELTKKLEEPIELAQ